MNTVVTGTAGQYSICNLNLTYFLGWNAADDNPQMILSGDRNIYGNSAAASQTTYNALANGGYGNSTHFGSGNTAGQVVSMGTNFVANAVSPCWTDKIHQAQGNVLLADASVQQFSNFKLRDQLRNTGDTSVPVNVLYFP